MKTTCKLSILLALLFGATLAYSQCETYLQKANTLFAEKKYEDAKLQYSNYKECKPNATGIDEKIAECDRFSKENNNNTKKPDRQPGKIYIGIGSFSGYKSEQAETNATAAFIDDGRFVVSKIQNSGWGKSTQEATENVDYIISGTATLTQREQTNYIDGGQYLGKVPITTPEVVSVVLTLTNTKTGQIVSNSTYKLNQIDRISGDMFPVKFTIKKINGKNIEIIRDGGGTYFVGDIYNVYEVYNNGGKNKIGALKIGKTNDKCTITDGAKTITSKFNSGAKLVVEK